MAVEKQRFGSFTVYVCDCRHFDDVKTLYGCKLIGQFLKYSGNTTTSLIFVSPHTATLKDSDEIEEWLKSLPTPSGVSFQFTE